MNFGSMKNMKNATIAMPTHDHHRRINQRRLELRLHLGELLEMLRHAAQHLHQRAALLARPHHVHVQIGKNHRLLRHRIGKTAAFHDFLPQILAHARRESLGFQCVMLCNATVSGMPEFNRFASCCVNVASSCIFGLRWRDIAFCIEGGRNDLKLICVPRRRPGAAAAPPFAASTITGNSPSRSICTSAAERSATSRIPSTTSPERRRALYEN